MKRTSYVGLVAAALIVAVGLGASVRGQEAVRQDVLGTLLTEVRALRAAIEQMSSASARVQLAMGRLQIQEQRVNALSRQLADARTSLSALERQRIEREAELADLEGVLPDTADDGERLAIRQRIAELKSLLGAGLEGLTRMRAEEAELAGVVAAEQGRWVALNEQLDALDRALRGQ